MKPYVIFKNKREIARYLNFTNKRIREPVSPAKREEALKLARNKCQYLGCPIKEGGLIKLEIHHKDWDNSKNRQSNLMVLCATHHGAIHRQYQRKDKRDILGSRISSKVVKRKVKPIKRKSFKKTTRSKKSTNLLPIPSSIRY